jgi:hypothetical protein
MHLSSAFIFFLTNQLILLAHQETGSKDVLLGRTSNKKSHQTSIKNFKLKMMPKHGKWIDKLWFEVKLG